MPLPQQVINQLSRDPAETPGWSSGVLLFSTILFIIVFATYFLMLFAYAPYLNSNLSGVQGKVATLDQSIASGDEAQLATFYSQIVNLQSLLKNHVLFSQFFDWLQQNTEVNVYYSQLSFSSGNQVTLVGVARTESDINEQIAIFEAAPAIQKVAISNAALLGSSGLWSFSATLTLSPSIFAASTTTP